MFKLYLHGVLLPVTPAKIITKIKGRNKTVDLLEGGETTIIKAAGLTDIEIPEVLLPNVQYPFGKYESGFKKANFYLAWLEALKDSESPIYFHVSRLGPDGKLIYGSEQMRVTLEDYQITDDAENGVDVVVKITLKQYIDRTIKRVVGGTVKKNARPAPVTVSKTAATTKTYKVKSGDTLWGICRRELGDGSKYKAVAKLNGITNPNKIKVGQVIRLV